jgi:hypothetical protein
VLLRPFFVFFFVFSTLCARKPHDQYTTLFHTLQPLRAGDRDFARRLLLEARGAERVETSHPYKFGANSLRRTVAFPGATHVALTFSSDCCTRNVQDDLRVYAGGGGGPALAQYFGASSGDDNGGGGGGGGGNGGGRRRGADSGANAWPQRTVLFPASSLTLLFSAKSKPVANDHSRW